MNGNDLASLAFLGLLGAAIAGSYLMSNRGNLGKTAQQAAIWGLIFVGTIAAIGMWGDIQNTVSPQQSIAETGQIIVPRGPDGHYRVRLDINDVPVNFIVDTGASQLVLTREDAERVGLKPDELRYLGTANTANGTVQTAAVWLDSVALGSVVDQNLPAVVNGGEMDASLLGMTYLGAFERLEIQDDQLILTR